jgi:hypothetical protein
MVIGLRDRLRFSPDMEKLAAQIDSNTPFGSLEANLARFQN